MARVYADANGKICGRARSDDEDALRFPNGAAGATSNVQFDEITNQALVDDIATNWDAYSIVGGVLKKNGVPVNIAADNSATTDRKAIKSNLTSLFTALRAGTATSAQQQRVLAFLLRQFLQG
jgi:hypothetical protein